MMSVALDSVATSMADSAATSSAAAASSAAAREAATEAAAEPDAEAKPLAFEARDEPFDNDPFDTDSFDSDVDRLESGCDESFETGFDAASRGRGAN